AWQQAHFPSTAKAGRLRISRRGAEATAWAAEGPGGAFQDLGRYDIGPDPITVIWLMAFTGHSSHALDLRVTDLTIRSAGPLPGPPPVAAEAEEPAPPPRPKPWRLLTAVVVLLLAGAAGLWWYARRRLTQARAALACPGCGEEFVARAELAGKKVKCPACGEAVRVPRPGE